MLLYSYLLSQRPFLLTEWKELAGLLPAEVLTKSRRFRRWQDQNNYLLGKLLLQRMLIKYFGASSDCLSLIRLGKHGKPFLNATLDFNISHSGQLVVCAISDEGPIGVDVEYETPFDLEDIAPFLRHEEWVALQENLAPRCFYTFWTKKESVLKATGLGLDLDLRKVLVFSKSGYIEFPYHQVWHFQQLSVPDQYLGMLCMQGADSNATFISPSTFLYPFQWTETLFVTH